MLYWSQFDAGYQAKCKERGEKPLYSMAKGEEILRAYAEQFREVEQEYSYLGGEVPVTLEVSSCPLPFVMVVDLLMESPDKRVYVFEFKFSTSLWRFVDDPNDQGIGYALGAEKFLGRPVDRIVYHISEVKESSIKGVVPARKKGEPGRSIFKRSIVDLDPWDREEWMADVFFKQREIEIYSANGYWPKRTRSCGDFGGCSFASLCVAPPNMREMFARANFEVKEKEGDEIS